jgi:hypothetical protein
MTQIDLTGLKPDLPIGAMAAFGCLRVCERLPGLKGSKLSWATAGYAVLHTPAPLSRDELVQALTADVKRAPERIELTWAEQIKTSTVAEFRKNAASAIDRATAADREAADWFAAFGSDLEINEDTIEPTPFDMSVARQKFIADAFKLALGLAKDRAARKGKTAAEAYAEALFGPWRYEDDQHSLGWDPTTMKLGAFTHKAPTTLANTGVRAAVWLAFESLPLFPCFYDGRLATRAFRRNRWEYALCWPVWRVPIGLDTLASLLALPALVADPPPAVELESRGIVAVYRSARFKPNKYLASFRPPELVYGTVA